MRINPFYQNLTTYKTKRQAMPLAASCLTAQTTVIRPSIPFTGGPLHVHVKNVVLPSLLKKVDGEIYAIKLFDKIKNKKIYAFLTVTADDTINYINVHGENAEIIGSTQMDFSCWKDHDLPKNYLRLHHLENFRKKRYAGVGSTIIQAAVEQSLKTEAEGRIYVFAYNVSPRTNDPFVFYNKMGLSVVSPDNKVRDLSHYLERIPTEACSFLEKRLQGKNIETLSPDEYMLNVYKAVADSTGRKLDEIRLNFTEHMYLHDDKVKDLWLPKIKANPIFSAQNRIK